MAIPSWIEMAATPPSAATDPEPTGPKCGRLQKAWRQLQEKFHLDVVWPSLSPLQLPPPPGPPRLPRSRASYCADVSVSRYTFLLAPADVAANSTYLASIVQRARRLGFGWEGFALECAAVCSEAGVSVATNVFVRDVDLGEFNGLDGRRVEVVADGLTLWRGAQLAVDNTLVSTATALGCCSFSCLLSCFGCFSVLVVFFSVFWLFVSVFWLFFSGVLVFF